jgi:hypothetical protein
MTSGYKSHLLCCLCVTVILFMCCVLWSDPAQLQTMLHCCNLVARPGPALPAQPGSCPVHHTNDTRTQNEQTVAALSGTDNEVYSVQQWSCNFNG